MSEDADIAVLVADDEEDFRVLLESHLRRDGCRVDAVSDGMEALDAIRGRDYDVAIVDILMPEMDGMELLRAMVGEEDEDRPEVIVLTGHGTMETAIEAMKLGAYDYLTKPYNPSELLLLVRKAWEHRQVTLENRRLHAREARTSDTPEVITQDPAMLEALRMAARVAPTDSPVLITGESGTGKELVARRIHRLSGRGEGALVPVNCAAIPETLLESELFGHEKGSFTGALDRKLGLFELADGGTLLLDEVGDLAPALQAKLLRALEDHTFRRVGGVKELRADVRVLTATNRSLLSMVEAQDFRQDLYYRLSTFILRLPPLRNRPDDIPLIARHFLRTLPGSGPDRVLSDEAVAKLKGYDWPGNVRELRNVMERAVLLSEGGRVEAEDLPLDSAMTGEGERDSGVPDTDPELSLEELEGRHIARVLDHTGWHQGNAAEILGISPKTLYRKIREYDLERPG